MKDNEYNRTKMRGFVMGLKAAKHMITSEDDPIIFQEDIDKRIESVCKEWNIKIPRIRSKNNKKGKF